MFLTKMSETRNARVLSSPRQTGQPPAVVRCVRLHGKRAAPLALPDNIICFCRRSATDLNRPQRGRALHHRFVLIFALETAVTVAVDDRAIRHQPGGGASSCFRSSFTTTSSPKREELRWLFVTFDMIDVPCRCRRCGSGPSSSHRVVRQTAAELVEAYLTRGEGDLHEPAAVRTPSEDTPGGADPPAPPDSRRSDARPDHAR